jgi:hypothetical protein
VRFATIIKNPGLVGKSNLTIQIFKSLSSELLGIAFKKNALLTTEISTTLHQVLIGDNMTPALNVPVPLKLARYKTSTYIPYNSITVQF